MNQDQLKELAKSSSTAQAIFNALATRERMRHFTDLTRFKTLLVNKGEHIVDKDYMKVFEKLQDMQAGSIIYGRNGKNTRFEWHYSLKDIGLAATTDKKFENIVRLPVKAKRAIQKATKPVVGNEVSLGNTVVFIPLRKNMDAEFIVPQDLKEEELQTIYAALKRAVKSA